MPRDIPLLIHFNVSIAPLFTIANPNERTTIDDYHAINGCLRYSYLSVRPVTFSILAINAVLSTRHLRSIHIVSYIRLTTLSIQNLYTTRWLRA